ncbi:hypothetical protein BGW36DRAFT_433863 [Talaromyces proteolyticus]|uniref:Glycine zipper 2TM domain-containing protein n=1 Tax=Talaromyces proteolyticus TaxID=1131652 RepID=A0AAD4KER0_9EURO|nr:uncharacterized protein BGW36DRAFT_433863 [Talaromyces proteolyticus]KAH8689098.1 hypothetical protein BGW36DRAFT_433863 [Talaromyces proteolyticus]
MSNREYYQSTGPEGQWYQENPQRSNDFPGIQKDEVEKNLQSSYSNQEDFRQQEQQQHQWQPTQGQNMPYTQPQSVDYKREPEMSQPDGERGLGATILGAAGGGMAGHHFGKESGHGTLGTIGGGVVGALLANAAEHALKDKHHGGGRHDRTRHRLEKKLERLG